MPWVIAFDMHEKGGSGRDFGKTSTLSMRAVDDLGRVKDCHVCQHVDPA
jgi:hypothetical protein